MNRLIKLIKLLSALVAIVLFSVGTAQADTLRSIEQSKTLRVAVLDAYPPWGFMGSDMQTVGFDIDFANYLSKKLGVKLSLTPSTGNNRIPYIQTGKVDLIIACLGKNAEREKAIDFSNSYGGEVNGIFGPPDLKINQAADLKGKTIGVARGSTEDMVLTQMAPSGTNILRYEDSSGSIQAFYSGQVDAVAIGATVVGKLNQRGTKRKLDFKITLKQEPTYIGMNKGQPALMAKVNEIIAGARKDGTLDTLSKKWFGVPDTSASN